MQALFQFEQAILDAAQAAKDAAAKAKAQARQKEEAVIRKDRPSSRRSGAKADGKRSTYTLRYLTRDTDTIPLF